MPQMLVLTAEQADQVRGPTTPGRALEPVEIGEGVFILPLAVLADDHGAAVLEILRSLPIEDVALPDEEGLV